MTFEEWWKAEKMPELTYGIPADYSLAKRVWKASSTVALMEVVKICDVWDDGGSCNVSNVRSEVEAMLNLLGKR